MSRGRIFVALLMLLLIFLSLPLPFAKAAIVPQTYEATVDHIVDGDTLYIDKPILGTRKVRYANIDTPETYHQPSYKQHLIDDQLDHSQKYHGERAKEQLQSLLPPGEEIILEVGQTTKDYYGRLLAKVIRKKDRIDTNLEMIQRGLAVTYFIWPVDDKHTYNQYQKALKNAKRFHLGIWDRNHPLMELPFVFRKRDHRSTYKKYVGNSETKEYVLPQYWYKVPVENRIFFNEMQQAQDAGYQAKEVPTLSPAPLYL
ncbi:thermonuclease family protein [Bacillus tianshenii]|nr:thermonuclease family protein [Bacillus tianshenii]